MTHFRAEPIENVTGAPEQEAGLARETQADAMRATVKRLMDERLAHKCFDLTATVEYADIEHEVEGCLPDSPLRQAWLRFTARVKEGK